MKVIAVNGSPRKKWSTHTLLEKALEGAKSAGAETEIIHLYDIDFKGCIGCLACKLKGPGYGRCVVKDNLKPILDAVAECDALILGSPIYLGEVTGEMRSFLERLLFQYISYDSHGPDTKPLFERRIKTSFIFTTNCPEPAYEKVGYTKLFSGYEGLVGRVLGECKILTVSETWPIDNSEKYHMAMFDMPARQRRREEVFPKDCEKAFDIGKWAAE